MNINIPLIITLAFAIMVLVGYGWIAFRLLAPPTEYEYPKKAPKGDIAKS
jgi:hypothetical protein